MTALTPLQLFLLAMTVPVLMASLAAWLTAYDRGPNPSA